MTAAATAAPLRSMADDTEPGDSAEIAPLIHRDYFERIMPMPPVICGRQMLPLSIGRYRLMHRFKVAFVADGPAKAHAGDLLLGVLIGSMRVDDFMEFVASPGFKKSLTRYSRTFGFLPPFWSTWPIIGWLWEKWFGEICGRVDMEKILTEIGRFQEYIRESQQAPRYWDETPASITSASHWSHSIEATLREFQGWSKEEINEEPLSKALWDYFKHGESQGLIRLMSDDEIAEADKPDDPEEAARWQEYVRKVELAKAGVDPNSAAAAVEKDSHG